MELSFLRGLYDTPGPWASVYLDDTHHADPAMAALKLRWNRWKAVRETLVDYRIAEPTLLALEAELQESPRGPAKHGLAMFAAHGEVRYAEIMGEPPRTDSADVSPLPHLTPLLTQRGEQIPWLRVIVDRVGADIQNPTRDVIRVEGSHVFPIRKAHEGSWSQERFQRKAEVTWQRNAKEVAEQVSRLATAVGAELVIVAGDARARELLIDRLPEGWRERLIESDAGSRAPGADLTALDEVTRLAVSEVVQSRTAETVDRLMAGSAESAAFGLAAVVAAFDRHQVDTLLLDPDGIAKTRLWVGLGLNQMAMTEEELRQLPVTEAYQVRAEDALIRAATVTDAELILISPADVQLDEGVGAVLRYVDPATVRG
jgi:hypothetical protein